MKLSTTALSIAIVVLWIGIATAVMTRGVSVGGSGFEGSAALLPGALELLTNTDRAANGIVSLSDNPLLDEAAQMKADDMALRGYYGHASPEGWLPFHWLDAVGYKYLNVGENLDLVYSGTEGTVNSDWMNSSEHRTNILLPQFTETGVGVQSGIYEGSNVTFVVELFATPMPASSPTPTPTPTRTPTPAPPVTRTIPATPAPLPLFSVPTQTRGTTTAANAPIGTPVSAPSAATTTMVVTASTTTTPTPAASSTVSTTTTVEPLGLSPLTVGLPRLSNLETYLTAFHTAFAFLENTFRGMLARFGIH
jgi:hypothetical protein